MIKLKNLLNEDTPIVRQIDDKKVKSFLIKYPKVQKSMLPFIGPGSSTMKSYVKWLRWKDKNEDKLGGNPETVNSPTLGTKTFYKHDWDGVSGWAEVFQYLSNNVSG